MLRSDTKAQWWLDQPKAHMGQDCKGSQWKLLHAEVFAEAGLDFHSADMDNVPDADFHLLLKNAGKVLTPRMRSVLFYIRQKLGQSACGPTCSDAPLVVDVSQSLGRVPVCTGGTPCVVPNSVLVVCGQPWRVLTPLEHFLLQGLDLRSNLAARSYSWNELNDLAGNAFSGHSFAVAVLAVLAVTVWPVPASQAPSFV